MIETSSNIIKYVDNLYGPQQASLYKDFIDSDHATYLRLNSLLAGNIDILSTLQSYGIITEQVPGMPFAYKITEGAEKAGKTLEHSLGLYYIQSLSSMIPPLVLDPSSGKKVLDLCSAPGSKATQLSEMMQNENTLICNEPSIDRVKMLVYNIDRMNLVNMGVINYKGEWLSRVYNDHFDKVLVDAPCSALGVVQKKGEVNNWWSLERVKKLTNIQLPILISGIKAAKPGGEIVYSTCSLTVEENEFILDYVLNNYPVEAVEIELPLKSHAGFTVSADRPLNRQLALARRILPWEVDSEGFFIIKLRKTGSIEPSKPLHLEGNTVLMNAGDKKISNFLKAFSDSYGIPYDEFRRYQYVFKGEDAFIVNENFQDENLSFFNRIGTRFGSFNNKGELSFHSYAAQIFNEKITERIFEISDTSDLLRYFSGGIIKSDVSSKGLYVVRYKGLALGTALLTERGLKSQLPKARRVNEISYY